MPLAPNKPLVQLCDELLKTVEELLLAGLTAASKSTIERIDVSFKEASRMKLLRLGSTLRIANEEIVRFHAGSTEFSARRLAFFLSRTWLLAHGIRRAIETGDERAFERLMATPAQAPVKEVRVVTLGVGKRVVPGAFAAFEFRLRVVEDAPLANGSPPLTKGEALVWSCVFPMRKDMDLPSEAFLHLPQKQKFKPLLFLEKRVLTIGACAVTRQPDSSARLALGETSTVAAGPDFIDWSSHWKWDAQRSRDRLASHQSTPLDLEIELQEEVVLHNWTAGALDENNENYSALAIESAGLHFEARLDRGPSGHPLRDVMRQMLDEGKRPPLFGAMHYEACRFVFQPLSALDEEGIRYLTVSADKISQAELVKAIKVN